MKRLTLTLVLAAALASGLPAAPAGAEQRGPSTPQERAKAIAVARLLETTPWTDEAKQGRAWVMTFIQEVPDLVVKPCRSLLGTPEQRKDIPADLVDQISISGAAYLLEHPGTGSGSTPTFLAALKGTLASYRAQKSHGSLPELPRLEDLLKVEASGQLEAYARGQGRNCQ